MPTWLVLPTWTRRLKGLTGFTSLITRFTGSCYRTTWLRSTWRNENTEMGSVWTGSFHVHLAGWPKRVQNHGIEKMDYRIHWRFIPVDHLLWCIRFPDNEKYHRCPQSMIPWIRSPREILTDHTETQYMKVLF
jgi:hypothetical protein